VIVKTVTRAKEAMLASRPDFLCQRSTDYFFAAQGFFAVQGFLAAQGLAAAVLLLAAFPFESVAAFLSVFAAHGFCWANVRLGASKKAVATIATIKRTTLSFIIISSLPLIAVLFCCG
jgi:hypothetical protein